MMSVNINRRYKSGLKLVWMKSSFEWLDPDDDQVIKTLFVVAEETSVKTWDLVAYLDVEVVGKDKQGLDNGFFTPEVEIYRIPFPYQPLLRKGLLRLIRAHPKFYKH